MNARLAMAAAGASCLGRSGKMLDSIKDRIFDSWARMILDVVDLQHCVQVVRSNGGTRETIEGMQATITHLQKEADKLKKIWDERKEWRDVKPL